jgi:hypothetical protein
MFAGHGMQALAASRIWREMWRRSGRAQASSEKGIVQLTPHDLFAAIAGS